MKKTTAFKALVTILALLLCAVAGCSGDNGGVDVDISPIEKPTAAPGTAAPATGAPVADATGTPVTDAPDVTPDATQPSPTPAQTASSTPAGAIDPSELDGTDEVKEPEKLSYSEYRALNSDVIGWIKISNTNVDYPIVKSSDNVDYLTKNAKKEDSKAGAIFMDYRCSANDSHVIIYGHNMSKSKIMFAQVTNYSNRSFYDANRTFKISFNDTEYTYKVFSVYSVDVNDASYMAVDDDIPSGAAFTDYMNNKLASLSIFPVDTTVGENDHVLTLSTCTHTNYANGRFVVHAVRVG